MEFNRIDNNRIGTYHHHQRIRTRLTHNCWTEGGECKEKVIRVCRYLPVDQDKSSFLSRNIACIPKSMFRVQAGAGYLEFILAIFGWVMSFCIGLGLMVAFLFT